MVDPTVTRKGQMDVLGENEALQQFFDSKMIYPFANSVVLLVALKVQIHRCDSLLCWCIFTVAMFVHGAV